MTNPAVSVICLVYNMKEYLVQTLESILMQKTNFPFEILVHDDVSTDGSTDIVREYAAKYPDIIVPIIQTENQYSKKDILITRDIILPAVRGKYAAYCEGDDYWTDPDKLQKQFDFMESHPDYSLCTAKVRQVDCSDEALPDRMVCPANHTGEITLEQILGMKNRQAFCTCSLFFRTDIMRACPKDFPNRGERTKIIWLALNGKVWYINDEVGVYRRKRPGSWTATSWQEGNAKKIATNYGFLRVYKKIDDYTQGNFRKYFRDIYVRYMQMCLQAGAKLRDIYSQDDISECYRRISSAQKLGLRFYSVIVPARNSLASAAKKVLSRR